jgi:hypothetical protein
MNLAALRPDRRRTDVNVVVMRLGVLDVGSNTVHLLVVDAHRGGTPIRRVRRRLSCGSPSTLRQGA